MSATTPIFSLDFSQAPVGDATVWLQAHACRVNGNPQFVKDADGTTVLSLGKNDRVHLEGWHSQSFANASFGVRLSLRRVPAKDVKAALFWMGALAPAFILWDRADGAGLELVRAGAQSQTIIEEGVLDDGWTDVSLSYLETKGEVNLFLDETVVGTAPIGGSVVNRCYVSLGPGGPHAVEHGDGEVQYRKIEASEAPLPWAQWIVLSSEIDRALALKVTKSNCDVRLSSTTLEKGGTITVEVKSPRGENPSFDVVAFDSKDVFGISARYQGQWKVVTTVYDRTITIGNATLPTVVNVPSDDGVRRAVCEVVGPSGWLELEMVPTLRESFWPPETVSNLTSSSVSFNIAGAPMAAVDGKTLAQAAGLGGTPVDVSSGYSQWLTFNSATPGARGLEARLWGSNTLVLDINWESNEDLVSNTQPLRLEMLMPPWFEHADAEVAPYVITIYMSYAGSQSVDAEVYILLTRAFRVLTMNEPLSVLIQTAQ